MENCNYYRLRHGPELTYFDSDTTHSLTSAEREMEAQTYRYDAKEKLVKNINSQIIINTVGLNLYTRMAGLLKISTHLR